MLHWRCLCHPTRGQSNLFATFAVFQEISPRSEEMVIGRHFCTYCAGHISKSQLCSKVRRPHAYDISMRSASRQTLFLKDLAPATSVMIAEYMALWLPRRPPDWVSNVHSCLIPESVLIQCSLTEVAVTCSRNSTLYCRELCHPAQLTDAILRCVEDFAQLAKVQAWRMLN